MCMSSPKIPAPPPPPQAVKLPDASNLGDSAARRRTGGLVSGSLLNGPSGIDNAQVTTGRTSLLGG